ncbi:PglL family O-oligosaccharyltransferase [Paucimonas lemoignei]|nr:O-antigen ligase family protein [Paucimonas lemoignei]
MKGSKGALFFMFIIISALSLFFSWLLPLHFPPWVSWHLECLAFGAMFAFSWAMLWKWRGVPATKAISVPVLALPFIGLAVLSVCQYAAGQITFAGDAIVFMLYMALCVLCIVFGFTTANLERNHLLAVNHTSGETVLMPVAGIILAGACASAIVAFAQVLDIWNSNWISRMPELRRPGANLGQPNHLATLVLMGIVSLLFLYELGKLRFLSSTLIFIILLTALVITESRTSIISFLVLIAWWFLKKGEINFKLPVWVPIAGVTTFLISFWFWPSIFVHIHQLDHTAEVNIRAGSRFLVWPQLIEALLQRPWFGWGIGEISEAHNAVAHAYSRSDAFSYSHNVLLDLGIGIGIPAAVFFCIFISLWLWARLKDANQLFNWYCLAVAMPIMVHSMFEFPYAYAYFLVPVIFALGFMEGIANGKVAFKIKINSMVVGLLILNGIAAWSVIEYIKIEEDFRVARFEALNMGKTPSEYERPSVIMLTQLGALLDGARISPKPGMTHAQLELARTVAMRYPWTATQNKYALSLALNGKTGESIRQLRVMRALHGEKAYNNIKAHWEMLAQEKFPQLKRIKLP